MAPNKAGPGPTKVLGYARVSTDEQAVSGAGLAAQREAIAQACAARGFKLVETIEDAGQSAKSLDRPGITRALAELDAHQADALVVAKLDRLSRSMLDFSGLMERARRRGWAIIALDLGVDTATPAGEMMANVLATFAQFERRLIGQRTKEALAQKRAQGVRITRPPSIPGDLLAWIVSELRAGSTRQAVCDRLNRDGVPTPRGGSMWRPSSIQAVAKTASAGMVGR